LVATPFLVIYNGTAGAANAACIAYLVITLAIGISFFKASGLPLKSLFSIKEDYLNLRTLIAGERHSQKAND
jgi:hypothetical protein